MDNLHRPKRKSRVSIFPTKWKDSGKHLSREHHGIKEGGMPLLLEVNKRRPSMEEIRTSRVPKVKRALISRIVPTSLIPLATATGMLVLGSHKSVGPNGDCYFNLPMYLVWAGAISTSLAIAGIVGRYVLEWIIADKVLTRGERNILLVLEYIGISLTLFQLIIIVAGALFIYPKIPTWQHEYKFLPNYCDYGMMIFSCVFFGFTLFIVALTTVFAIVIVFCDTEKRKTPPPMEQV